MSGPSAGKKKQEPGQFELGKPQSQRATSMQASGRPPAMDMNLSQRERWVLEYAWPGIIMRKCSKVFDIHQAKSLNTWLQETKNVFFQYGAAECGWTAAGLQRALPVPRSPVGSVAVVSLGSFRSSWSAGSVGGFIVFHDLGCIDHSTSRSKCTLPWRARTHRPLHGDLVIFENAGFTVLRPSASATCQP